MKLTKRFVKDELGCKSDAALGRWLGVSRKAVCKWPKDGPLPVAQQLRCAVQAPHLFLQAFAPRPFGSDHHDIIEG